MNTLEVPGAFTALVPDGWRATRQDDTFELLTDIDDSAAHISFYSRSAGPLGADEAGSTVARFASRMADEPEIRVLRENKTQHRAVTKFVDGSEGAPQQWLVLAVLWPERLVMCSWNGAPGSTAMGEAEQMFASISPPRRSIFRRR